MHDFTFRSHNNNNNNDRLPSKIPGWLANPGGKRLKPIEEIFQEELNACLSVSTRLRGLQLQKFIYEIRTSGGHNVRLCSLLLNKLEIHLLYNALAALSLLGRTDKT